MPPKDSPRIQEVSGGEPDNDNDDDDDDDTAMISVAMAAATTVTSRQSPKSTSQRTTWNPAADKRSSWGSNVRPVPSRPGR